MREVVEAFRAAWSRPLPVSYADETRDAARLKREAGLLRVDPTKAKVELGWRPALGNAAAVQNAAAWYGAFRAAGDARAVRALTEGQIESVLGV